MSAVNDNQLTNEQFLQFLFGKHWKRALVAWFPGDPSPGSPDVNWSAHPARALPPEALQRDMNMYFCPSLVCSDRRIITDFVSFHVLVIDDYGTKVPAGKPEYLLGMDATYVLETSPGNYQAGWKLNPPLTDLAWLKGMLVRLHAVLGGGDNLTDPVIWRRLPVGVNGKPKYRTNDNGPAWRMS